MDIKSIDQLKTALEAASRIRSSAPPEAGAAGVSSFGSALDKALNDVSELQQDAQKMQKAFQQGDPSVSLEQTMVSMQKSAVSFQAALTVRNRLVSAYTDIMNMQV